MLDVESDHGRLVDCAGGGDEAVFLATQVKNQHTRINNDLQTLSLVRPQLLAELLPNSISSSMAASLCFT